MNGISMGRKVAVGACVAAQRKREPDAEPDHGRDEKADQDACAARAPLAVARALHRRERYP